MTEHKYGDRTPAIFYNKGGFLHFSNAVSGTNHFNFDYNIELNKLYHIEIAQEDKGGKVCKRCLILRLSIFPVFF